MAVERSSRRSWVAVVLEVPAGLEDEIAGALGGASLGVHATPGPAGRTTLRVYDRAARTRAEIERVLRSCGADPRSCHVRVEAVPDGHWAERYQAGLAAFPLGRGFWVDPQPGGAPPAGASGDRVTLRLVPGRAFGTGEHPTTRMCAALLEDVVVRGSRWLDLGCGTGILSLVAHRCGAGEVLGLDTDPDAVAVCHEVLVANGIERGVRAAEGSLEAAVGAPWDGVVANVDAPLFLERAAGLAGLLRAGGALVASGFLAEAATPIAAVLDRAGLATERRRVEDGWATLLARSAR